MRQGETAPRCCPMAPRKFEANLGRKESCSRRTSSAAPSVPLFRASWLLFGGIQGLLEGSWVVLAHLLHLICGESLQWLKFVCGMQYTKATMGKSLKLLQCCKPAPVVTLLCPRLRQTKGVARSWSLGLGLSRASLLAAFWAVVSLRATGTL